ncbi:uncharacterized protein LOC120336812 isoform X2 [Styela clava]
MYVFVITVLFFFQFSTISGQVTGKPIRWFNNGDEEFFASEGTRQNAEEAQNYCQTQGATLVTNTDKKSLFLKKHIRREIFYYVGATVTVAGFWSTGEQLQNSEGRLNPPLEKHCLLSAWTSGGRLVWKILNCSTKHAFICQRKGRFGTTTPEVQLSETTFAEGGRIGMDTAQVKLPESERASTMTTSNQPVPDQITIGCSFHLTSLLIGMAIPLPFLIFAVIMACRKCRKTAKVIEEGSNCKYDDTEFNGNSYLNYVGNHQNGSEIPQITYDNIEAQSQHYEIAYSGYERPISSAPEAVVYEVEAYEDIC